MRKDHVRNIRRMLLCMALISCFVPNAFGDLIVDSWTLGTTVYDYAASDFDTSFTESVENPYQSTLIAMYGNSHASAIHDFGWSGDFAHFDAVIDHYVQQLNGDTTTEGSIYIRPAVDTNIILSGSWQFSWPGVILGQTSISLFAHDLDTDQTVALAHAGGGNVGHGQPFGNLHVQDSGLLVAGNLYLIHYITQIDQLTPTPPPGTHGEGSGEVHFSLTPVPEPATLGLIVFAVLILRRRP